MGTVGSVCAQPLLHGSCQTTKARFLADIR